MQPIRLRGDAVALEECNEFADDAEIVGLFRGDGEIGEVGIEWFEGNGLVFPAIRGQ